MRSTTEATETRETTPQKGHIHNTKLKLLDDLGNPVDDLGLAQVDLRTFWRLHCAAVKDSRSWQEKADDSFFFSAQGSSQHVRGYGLTRMNQVQL